MGTGARGIERRATDGLLVVQQAEVGGRDEPGSQHMLDKNGSAFRSLSTVFIVQPAHTFTAELVAHVVEFAANLRVAPRETIRHRLM
jgi:hypothetical protein